MDRLKETMQELSDLLRSNMNQIGQSAKNKAYQLIEDWVKALPKLEEEGFEVTSFALSVAISPALDVELKGIHTDFSMSKIQYVLDTNKGNTVITTVFTTLKTTYQLHKKINAPLKEPLIVKVKVRISPEIKVFIGEPIIQ